MMCLFVHHACLEYPGVANGSKGKKLGSINNYTYNKPGVGVSVDQLQSDQNGLVPQLSYKLTSARIWAAQLIVEQYSDVTNIHLVISSI